MGTSLAIEASGLTKRFGDVVAVNNLSLNIQRGEIYGFLGLNGAGKTTTIRMLLGMIRPSTGSVSLLGTKVQPGQGNIWQRVGYMVETPHAYPDLTVRENLEISRRLRQLKNADSVEKIVEQMGLAPYANRRAGILSLGNAQRLGLAKALIHHPDLLLLDEPANGLDPAGIVEVRTQDIEPVFFELIRPPVEIYGDDFVHTYFPRFLMVLLMSSQYAFRSSSRRRPLAVSE